MKDKLKVLIISPTAPQWRVPDGKRASRKTRAFRFSMLPCLYVAASMPPYVECRIIDEDVEPLDCNTDADLIAISLMTYNAPHAYAIADVFRTRYGKPVILGGYHPTFMPEEAKEHADAVCIGEAEPNVPEMIADFVAGKLKPFYRNTMTDLKGLPIPDRSLLHQSAYLTPYAVQATRGCPNMCKFCSVSAFAGHRHRTRPIEEVIAELKTLGRNLLFMDDNIIADTDYAKELFAALIPLRKRWASQCSVKIVQDRELLRLARDAGCVGLFIGFESLSQKNLEEHNKSFNTARNYQSAVKKLHDNGIGVYAGIVFGMDADYADVFEKTLTFLDEAQVDLLQSTVLTPFPGTTLHREMEAEGRIFDRDWSHYDFGHVVFQPEHMSPNTLRAGRDWVSAQFYSRRRVLKRIGRAFTFLRAGTVLSAQAPLNLGYRQRCRVNGVFRDAKAYTPLAVPMDRTQELAA